MEFTGYSSVCKKCNTNVKSRYIGKNPNGVASYLITCECPSSAYCPMCNNKVGNRKRVGPNGSKNIFILVDECFKCGSIVPAESISRRSWIWVDRWNKRVYKNYMENV